MIDLASCSGHAWMSKAEMRGSQGEGKLLRILERSLPLGGDSGYRIIRNLMFETPTGTTQIDFTIVSAFGIFIGDVPFVGHCDRQ